MRGVRSMTSKIRFTAPPALAASGKAICPWLAPIAPMITAKKTLSISSSVMRPATTSWPPYQNASPYTANIANCEKPKPMPVTCARLDLPEASAALNRSQSSVTLAWRLKACTTRMLRNASVATWSAPAASLLAVPSVKPCPILAWMRPEMTMSGTAAMITSVIFQPLMKAMVKPTAKVVTFWKSSPAASPTAPRTYVASVPSRAVREPLLFSSRSNQPTSCFSIASNSITRTRLDRRAPMTPRLACCTSVQMNEPRPTSPKMPAHRSALRFMSSGSGL
mmetsp:Transcript_22048/g.57471  ORF Transcript_22048/g.57471 Transcript_22048/m.57471 type:complete len:279 (-) Transcript_22048:367-1203(-)